MMKLSEIAFFTDNVTRMTDFDRRLLGTEPVACSDTMAIFFTNETKIFIHYKYAQTNGELPPEIPPQEFYWGRSAYLRDPDGHQIEILQMEKSHAG